MTTVLVFICLSLLSAAFSALNKDASAPKCSDETALFQRGVRLAHGAQRHPQHCWPRCASLSQAEDRPVVGKEVSSTITGLSLLQRWASPPHPGALELSSEELTRYITTGRLPTQVLAQLQNSSTDSEPSSSAEDRATQEVKEYTQKADKILGEMKTYEDKLDVVRLQAQAAYNKTAEQEKRLSANFHNVSKVLDALIQKAAHEASSAEVQTMVERLQRIHYKQISTLDRSATYWLELAEKETEARRVAEARGRLLDAKQTGTGLRSEEMQQAATQEKAEMDAWFKDYWAQLEESEKVALEKQARREERSKEPKEEPYIEVIQPAVEAIEPAVEVISPSVVEVKPGDIVPASTP